MTGIGTLFLDDLRCSKAINGGNHGGTQDAIEHGRSG